MKTPPLAPALLLIGWAIVIGLVLAQRDNCECAR